MKVRFYGIFFDYGFGWTYRMNGHKEDYLFYRHYEYDENYDHNKLNSLIFLVLIR